MSDRASSLFVDLYSSIGYFQCIPSCDPSQWIFLPTLANFPTPLGRRFRFNRILINIKQQKSSALLQAALRRGLLNYLIHSTLARPQGGTQGGRTPLSWKTCTSQYSKWLPPVASDSSRVHQIRFRPGLGRGPRLESSQRSPMPQLVWGGPTSKERETKGTTKKK